jgi:hypothetical protein
MAAIAFDPLEFTHELEASGVPREQAEVHAKAMTARFLHNFDALVTTDYLDTRFTEFELRVESKLDKRLAELETNLDARFSNVDERFASIDARFDSIDERFASIDARFAQMDTRFSKMDVRFERMEGKFSLVFWMLGLTIVCVVVPEILKFLS